MFGYMAYTPVDQLPGDRHKSRGIAEDEARIHQFPRKPNVVIYVDPLLAFMFPPGLEPRTQTFLINVVLIAGHYNVPRPGNSN